jgi:hypothetical protein
VSLSNVNVLFSSDRLLMSGLAVVMSLMEASQATCGLIGRACGSALTALCQFGWPVGPRSLSSLPGCEIFFEIPKRPRQSCQWTQTWARLLACSCALFRLTLTSLLSQFVFIQEKGWSKRLILPVKVKKSGLRAKNWHLNRPPRNLNRPLAVQPAPWPAGRL